MQFLSPVVMKLISLQGERYPCGIKQKKLHYRAWVRYLHGANCSTDLNVLPQSVQFLNFDWCIIESPDVSSNLFATNTKEGRIYARIRYRQLSAVRNADT